MTTPMTKAEVLAVLSGFAQTYDADSENGRAFRRAIEIIGVSSDGDVVGATIDAADDLLHRVEGFGKAYPTDIFREVEPDERRVKNQMMKWAGIPVWVDGVVTTNPENWPLIDANDMTPKPPGQPSPDWNSGPAGRGE